MPILPKKIEIHGYFAFRQPQEILFEPLWKSGGLWGILGSNGAGKSSILEAILLALYHESPRKSSEAIIKTRGFAGNPYIRFYFDYQGQTYVCAYPTKGITNIEKNKPEDCKIINPKGVQDLLGLSYKDFILTVVLPQGQFASFLESTLSEQSRILSNLLPYKPWQIIMEKVKQVQSFLKEQRKLEQGKKEALTSQLNTLSGVTQERLETLEKELQELENRRIVVSNQLNDLNTQLQMARQRDELQQKYERLTGSLSDLRSQKEALEKILDPEISTHLQQIEHFTRMIASIKPKILQKDQEVQRQDTSLQKIKKDVANLRSKYDKLRPLHEKQTELLELVSLSKNYKQATQSLQAYLKQLIQKLQQLKSQKPLPPEQKVEDLQEELQKGDDFWRKLSQTEAEITAALEEAEKEREKLRIDEALAKYVAELREGEPCPICGATHHPAKRQIPPDLSEKLKQVENKRRTFQQDKESLTQVLSWEELINKDLQQYRQKKEEFRQLGSKLCQEISREDIENFLKLQKPEDIFKECEDLRNQLQKLEREVVRYEENLKGLKVERENLQKELENYEAQRKAEETELLQLLPEKLPWYATFWQKLRSERLEGAQKWAHQTFKETKDKLTEYEDLHKRLHEDDSYKNLPPTPELENQVESLSSEQQSLDKQISQCNREKGEIESKLRQKDDLINQLEETWKNLETLEAELSVIEKAALAVSGGELEKFFVRHFLLRHLIEEVNGYLREWLGGALELQMPEEQGSKSSKKDELLQIRDVFSARGEPRPPHTLSGGEKFLVSLAMALALSDHIMRLKNRNSKSQPSFFFIDEGFDTLSTENFAFVMRTLQRLAAQGRYIGLISHKIEAREYLSAYLKVEKENHTTRVKLYQNTYGSSDFT